MSREIKFRGKGIDGKYYYGDLVHFIDNSVAIKVEGCDDCEEVLSESVAQLWGYDENGKEIYEGDDIVGLIDQYGKVPQSKAVLTPMSEFDSSMIYKYNDKEITWIKINTPESF